METEKLTVIITIEHEQAVSAGVGTSHTAWTWDRERDRESEWNWWHNKSLNVKPTDFKATFTVCLSLQRIFTLKLSNSQITWQWRNIKKFTCKIMSLQNDCNIMLLNCRSPAKMFGICCKYSTHASSLMGKFAAMRTKVAVPWNTQFKVWHTWAHLVQTRAAR